jgi:hypothetical protein
MLRIRLGFSILIWLFYGYIYIFFKKICIFTVHIFRPVLFYLAFFREWYGQFTIYSLIFDVLSKFGVEIDKKVYFLVIFVFCHKSSFLEKVEKLIFSTTGEAL